MINLVLLIILIFVSPFITFLKIRNSIKLVSYSRSSPMRLLHYLFELLWAAMMCTPAFIIIDLNLYHPFFINRAILRLGSYFSITYYVIFAIPNIYVIYRHRKEFGEALRIGRYGK